MKNKNLLIIMIIISFVILLRMQFISVHKDIKKYYSLTSDRINYLENMLTVQLRNHIEDILGSRLVDFVTLLKKYDASDQDGPINLVRVGKDYDGGYVVPEKALKSSDVLLGYGILDDISFEEGFSYIYQKPSYGFDCTTTNIEIKNKLAHFIPECIGSSDDIQRGLYTNSDKKFTSFDQQLDYLGLKNKKLFIKIDIEGNEYSVINDILKYSSNITGIAMELHFDNNLYQFKLAKDLINLIKKDFVLLHIHGNATARNVFTASNVQGKIPRVIELTYINKNLVTEYNISKDQKHPTILDMPSCQGMEDHKFEIK